VDRSSTFGFKNNTSNFYLFSFLEEYKIGKGVLLNVIPQLPVALIEAHGILNMRQSKSHNEFEQNL
jgi:hypothetical protein